MIIIKTTKVHLQKLNISEFRRRRLYSLRVCVHFPIILQYHQKNVLNAYPLFLLRFQCFAFIFISARNFGINTHAAAALVLMSFLSFTVRISHIWRIYFGVYEMDASHGYIRYQGSVWGKK